MSTQNQNGADIERSYHAYTDYEDVTARMSGSIAQALEDYSMLHSLKAENVVPKDRDVAQTRANLLAAAIRIRSELDAGNIDNGEAIKTRWETGGAEYEEGFIEKLHDHELEFGYESWLFQLVQDLRRAAWELGYLQAGEHRDESDDPVEDETDKMLKGL